MNVLQIIFSSLVVALSFEHEKLIEQIWPYLEFPRPKFYKFFLKSKFYFFNVTMFAKLDVTRHLET